MKNKTTKAAIGAALAVGMMFAGVQAATASDDASGYRECTGAQKARINSNTSTSGSPTGTFAVAHGP